MIAIADIFRANIVDVQKDSLIIELTGGQSKLAALIDMLSDYQIAEIARTGITGLSRGAADVVFLEVFNMHEEEMQYGTGKDLLPGRLQSVAS